MRENWVATQPVEAEGEEGLRYGGGQQQGEGQAQGDGHAYWTVTETGFILGAFNIWWCYKHLNIFQFICDQHDTYLKFVFITQKVGLHY
jgi:hypothetical protein